MANENTAAPIQFALDETGDNFKFASPNELRIWVRKTAEVWQWATAVPSPFNHVITRGLQNFQSQVDAALTNWPNAQTTEQRQQLSDSLRTVFAQFLGPPLVIVPESPTARFVEKIREERGDLAGAAAYSSFLRFNTPTNAFPSATFFEGLFEGFLFRHGIKKTGAAYLPVLEDLRVRYSASIAEDDNRARAFQERNAELNEEFQKALAGQGNDFQVLINKHVAQLEAIEETYDRKLALRKPVAYWRTKEKSHTEASKKFGTAALLSGIALLVGMGFLIHWIFKDLAKGESPEHWQFGMLLMAVFFVIWLLRILLRLFFSHIHLASDAAERRTMILTFLALSREGSEVALDDRKLILQHLFRSASDGLVKDEAAPGSLLEYFSRIR